MRKMYKVFIVDDEPFIIEGLYDILDWSNFGLEIVGHAENGQQALDALREKPADVLLTDISMPVMNGLSLIAEARKLHKDLKVIILSGFNEFDYLKEGMQLGIENYLLKPINVEELESTLRNTVDKLNRHKTEDLYDAFDIQILKDNTLYRWLTGQIAAKELEERFRLLDLSLEAPWMVVGVLRTQYHLPEIFERTVEFLEHDENMTVFRDVDRDIVIVSTLYSRTAGADFKTRMDALANALTNSGLPVQIGIGTVDRLQLLKEGPIHGEGGGSESYEEAKRALEYFMIYPDRKIIESAWAESSRGSEDQPDDLNWTDYAKLIMARESEELKARIEADFKNMQSRQGIRPEDLRVAALELVVRFKIELRQIKYDDEPDIFHDGLGRIRNSTSFEDLLAILREVAEQTVGSLMADVTNPVVNQVLDHIHQHYADELSLKKLGAQYHIHPVYLGQLFHKQTSSTFAEYINKYRIEKAKQLLKNTNLKVQEIARNVGYWEIGYFYKQFRKFVGISPTDYKALQ